MKDNISLYKCKKNLLILILLLYLCSNENSKNK